MKTKGQFTHRFQLKLTKTSFGRFSRSFTQQWHFEGLKMQAFENGFQSARPGLREASSCVNDSSCSFQTILLQFEPYESSHYNPAIWP